MNLIYFRWNSRGFHKTVDAFQSIYMTVLSRMLPVRIVKVSGEHQFVKLFFKYQLSVQ